MTKRESVRETERGSEKVDRKRGKNRRYKKGSKREKEIVT